jgi:signal peptidase I
MTEPNPSSIPQWRATLWENIKTIAIALLCVFLIRTFLAEPRYIPSDSMLPTLETGDRVVVEKVSYHFHPPTMGDVIVFNPPSLLQDYGYLPKQAFIKRVMATGGHHISVHDDQVYRDDEPLTEPYIAIPPHYEMSDRTIPDHRLFVMGDNRNNSNDSHIWGELPEGNVIGRAVFRFWPPQRIGWL